MRVTTRNNSALSGSEGHYSQQATYSSFHCLDVKTTFYDKVPNTADVLTYVGFITCVPMLKVCAALIPFRVLRKVTEK